ncbi:MAG: nicotinamide-nucleotide amidohydrolase family protein [Alphaproteobacteria bacterium]|nr:nicotinamide-nucleotide amidohydrolase family protein [Alphaproteobacteria bacterium]
MTIAQDIITLASEHDLMIATAESCTGGMIAAALTDIAGSSVAVDRGFVTYSNAAKMQELGVTAASLEAHGAVSMAVVLGMAEGAARAVDHPRALAVSVSGVAGPGGGSKDKPVGLVWFGLCRRQGEAMASRAVEQRFSGDRAAVRAEATRYALEMLKSELLNASLIA